MKQWKICCLICLIFVCCCFGCASQQIKADLEPDDDIEERIEVLSGKLAEALRNRNFATANLAIIEESSIGKRIVSQFGTFVTDRLRQQLTWKNFSIIDIKGAHWLKILDNKPIGTPETDCERKESPDVILLLNVKDYGLSSKNIYVSVTGKRTDSNLFIEGLVVEEQFSSSGRIVSWLKDTKPVTLPLGTENNPFKTIDNGAEYLANTVCCPYRDVVKKWERGELGLQNINPEDITLVVMAVNSRTRKMGRFEQLIMQKIKSYLIKNCGIENAVDFSDYGLIDRQLSFYEKEGTFKLDFTASNRERFKPGTVLLIAETFYRDNLKADVMIRASWMKGRAETVAGDRRSVGGTYLPGFASNAYFNWVRSPEEIADEAEAAAGPVKKIVLSVNGAVGGDRLMHVMEDSLSAQGYRVVSAEVRGRKLTVEVKLGAERCFEEIDSCYDFHIESLRILDHKGAMVKSLQDTSKYTGKSKMTDSRNDALSTGINRLWESMTDDFMIAVKSCVE